MSSRECRTPRLLDGLPVKLLMAHAGHGCFSQAVTAKLLALRSAGLHCAAGARPSLTSQLSFPAGLPAALSLRRPPAPTCWDGGTAMGRKKKRSLRRRAACSPSAATPRTWPPASGLLLIVTSGRIVSTGISSGRRRWPAPGQAMCRAGSCGVLLRGSRAHSRACQLVSSGVAATCQLCQQLG